MTARQSVQQMGAATAANVGATLLGVFVPVLRSKVGANTYIIAGQASSGAALQQALPEINATITGFHAMTGPWRGRR